MLIEGTGVLSYFFFQTKGISVHPMLPRLCLSLFVHIRGSRKFRVFRGNWTHSWYLNL